MVVVTLSCVSLEIWREGCSMPVGQDVRGGSIFDSETIQAARIGRRGLRSVRRNVVQIR